MIPFEEEDARAIAARFGSVPEVRAVRVPCDTEDEWLDARRGGIGASEIATIAGRRSYTSPYALWWRRKLGWRLPRTEAQRWGHLVEDPIAEIFREETGLYVAKPLGAPYSLWRDPSEPWMVCTPDRLAVEMDDVLGPVVHPVELKSDEGGPGWGRQGSDEVPDAVRLQLLWQAAILGSDGGWVVRKRGSGRGGIVWYWVPWDEALVRDLIVAGREFLDSDEPPEPDGSKATTEALKEIHPAVDAGEVVEVPFMVYVEWHRAREEKRKAERGEKLASNRLRAAMGRAEFAAYRTGDGMQIPFARRRVGKRDGYQVGPGETDKLEDIGGHGETAGDLHAGPAAAPGGDGGGAPLPGDAGAAPPTAEEEQPGGGGEGAEMGERAGGGEGGDDPTGPPVSWSAASAGIIEDEVLSSLPPELADLAARARRAETHEGKETE